MSYVILCTVSGGVTGTRSGYLKSDGETRHFESLDQADDEASRLNREMNGSNRASFNYIAMTSE